MAASAPARNYATVAESSISKAKPIQLPFLVPGEYGPIIVVRNRERPDVSTFFGREDPPMLAEIAHQAQRIFNMAAHFGLPLIGFDRLQFSHIRSRRPLQKIPLHQKK